MEIQAVFMLFDVVDTAVRSDVRPRLYMYDGRIRENLWDLIISIQNINTLAMVFVLSDSYQRPEENWLDMGGGIVSHSKKIDTSIHVPTFN